MMARLKTYPKRKKRSRSTAQIRSKHIMAAGTLQNVWAKVGDSQAKNITNTNEYHIKTY